MAVTISAWVLCATTLFLLFIMVFLSTGSVDNLQENYKPVEEKKSLQNNLIPKKKLN